MQRSIILAGGEGERTRPFIERWLGSHRPKQYCRFVGRRTMFQHTVDRADRLSPGVHRFSVVSEGHRSLVRAQLAGRPSGRLLWQPQNRGTGAGILWPISCLMRKHPDDIVVIYPSDHFIRPESSFLSVVSDAVERVAANVDRVVLLGAKPNRLELDYGWIQPGGEGREFRSRSIRSVHRFLEKPSEAEAGMALAEGALWNTLIVIGAVRTFWQLGRYCMPETMQLLDWLGSETGSPQEHELTQRIYASLPEGNFSSEVLEKAPEFLEVMELSGIEWSDWGRPERIAESVQSLGRKPAFPLSLVPDFRQPEVLRPAGHFAQSAILSSPGIG